MLCCSDPLPPTNDDDDDDGMVSLSQRQQHTVMNSSPKQSGRMTMMLLSYCYFIVTIQLSCRIGMVVHGFSLFHPTRPTTRTIQRQNHVEGNDRIRCLLDEAVAVHQLTVRDGSSTDDIQDIIETLGGILGRTSLEETNQETVGRTTEPPAVLLDKAIAKSLVEDSPSSLEQVELAAALFLESLHRESEEPEPAILTALDDSTVSDVQNRLIKMKQTLPVRPAPVIARPALQLDTTADHVTDVKESIEDEKTHSRNGHSVPFAVVESAVVPDEVVESIGSVVVEANEEGEENDCKDDNHDNDNKNVVEEPIEQQEQMEGKDETKDQEMELDMEIEPNAETRSGQDQPGENSHSHSTIGQDEAVSASADNKNDDSATGVDDSVPTPTESSSTTPSTDSSASSSTPVQDDVDNNPAANDKVETEVVDVAIVGAGIGGLCAGAILNTLYGKKVGIYESHYLAGGCAHAFDRKAPNGMTFTFDSGPTIVLGCSKAPFNPLRQVLNAVGESVEWIRYDGWGMIESPGKDNEKRWKVELGVGSFENGPLRDYGGEEAVREFQELRVKTKDLVSGAVEIPAMAMRAGKQALIPLLRYLPALATIIGQGERTLGTFAPYMDGPIFTVKNPWFRSWLDALAFSLSGLPASRTSAAAMAYVLFDMHREGAALDYPQGGLGSVVDALVRAVQQGDNGSKVNLRTHVESIDTSVTGGAIEGLTLRGGKKVHAKDGVICNTPVWALNGLIKNEHARRALDGLLLQEPPNYDQGNDAKNDRALVPRQTWIPGKTDRYVCREDYEASDNKTGGGNSSRKGKPNDTKGACDTAEQTGSFLHLHLALDATGLDLDAMEAHYTVMDRSLGGDGSEGDGPCGEQNMIAVSNPCVIDRTLAPEGTIVVHAYGAGNEPYQIWEGMNRNSDEYKKLKEQRAAVLWRAVESVIPDARDRVILDLTGSPLTHESFLRRPRGTYGSATEDYLKDGSTPYERLVLAGDGVFPGIGIPSVALSGASAANSLVDVWQQWRCLDRLKKEDLI